MNNACGSYDNSTPANLHTNTASYWGVPIPYLNGSVTIMDGWEYEGHKGTFYNSTENLHTYWDSMVLNYWPVMTLMVNATDPNVPDDDRPPGIARMHCIAPNGVGTGKSFNFAGIVPAGTDETADGGDGIAGQTDDKNSGVRLCTWRLDVMITSRIL